MRMLRHLLCLALVLGTTASRSTAAGRPRLDTNGDPLPEGAIARFGSGRFRHEHPVFGVAYSPDGKTIATAGNNRQLWLWEAKTGKLLNKFTINNGFNGLQLQSVCFSPRGDLLLVGVSDASIRVLNAKTGAQVRVLSGHHRSVVTSMCVAADGKTLVSTDQVGQTIVWSLETGAVRRQYTGAVNTRWSGPVLLDGGKSFLVLGTDGTVHVVETSSGKVLRKLVPSRNGGVFFNGQNQALAVSPDGKRLAVGGWGRNLTIWDLASGKELKRFDTQQVTHPMALTFSPNGRFLAASLQGQAVVFVGVASGKELRRLKATGYQSSVAFAPDGKTVAVATGNPVIRVWDVAAARDVFPGSGHQGQVTSVVFTPDGKHLVSSGNMGEVCLWEVASSRELAVHHFTFGVINGQHVQLSADGKCVQILGYDRAVHTWTLPLGGDHGASTRQAANVMNPHQATLSPDGKRAVAMGPDRRVTLYDLAGGKTRSLDFVRNGYLAAATFSPDSRRVAVSGPDGSVQVWDVITGRRLLTLGDKRMPGYYRGGARMAFSADGRSLLVFDGWLRVCEVASGRDRYTEPGARPVGYVPINGQVAYSPDGRLLARGNLDGSIAVYATRTGAELARWQSQQGQIQALAFSRDGRRLASGGTNATLLVWEVPQAPRPALVLNAARLDKLWQELAHDDAHRAYQAMETLAADPARALPFLKERLRPPPPVDAQRVARLIDDLGNDAYRVREKATAELAAAGAPLEDTLRRALRTAPSVEAKRRLGHLLALLREGGVSPESLRLLRALEVLDGLGTPEARRLIQELSKIAHDRGITAEIRAALEHHAGPPAAPAPKPGE